MDRFGDSHNFTEMRADKERAFAREKRDGARPGEARFARASSSRNTRAEYAGITRMCHNHFGLSPIARTVSRVRRTY